MSKILTLVSMTIILVSCVSNSFCDELDNHNLKYSLLENYYSKSEVKNLSAIVEKHRDENNTITFRIYDPHSPKYGGILIVNPDEKMKKQLEIAILNKKSLWIDFNGILRPLIADWQIDPSRDPVALLKIVKINKMEIKSENKFPSAVIEQK